MEKEYPSQVIIWKLICHNNKNKTMKFYAGSHFIQNLSQHFHRLKMFKYYLSKKITKDKNNMILGLVINLY